MVSINDRLAYNYSDPQNTSKDFSAITRADAIVGSVNGITIPGRDTKITMLTVCVDKHATEQATIALYIETKDWNTWGGWSRVCNADGTDRKLIEFTVPTGTGTIGKTVDLSWLGEPVDCRVVAVITTATARMLGCSVRGFGRMWVE